MRILMVSHYPPKRDGLATYAQQAVRALRSEGHEVEVLSPGPSAAHHYLDLKGPRGALALAKRVRNYDKVIVQFHPDTFYGPPPNPAEWIKEHLALTVAFRRAHQVEVVVHEIDYRRGNPSTREGKAARLLWNSVDRILVHSEQDKNDFARGFGVPHSKIHIIPHGGDFISNTRYDKVGARHTLGIPEDAFSFVSIGFILPNKGYDRAVRAFSGLAEHGARLDIVGSVRVDDANYLDYVEDLASLIEETDGAHLHQGYVSDEVFDRWIVASDVVVLPYRVIFSSGVLERALLLGRHVIATNSGGLPDQVGDREGVTLVNDNAELQRAMWSAAGVGDLTGAIPLTWPTDGEHLRRKIQQEIIQRASASRGGFLSERQRIHTDLRRRAAPVARAASAPIRHVGFLEMPQPTSTRPFVSGVKKAIRRFTAWEIQPLIDKVNELQTATARAVEDAVVRAIDSSTESGHPRTESEHKEPEDAGGRLTSRPETLRQQQETVRRPH